MIEDRITKLEAEIEALKTFMKRLMEHPMISHWVKREDLFCFYGEHHYPGKEE